MQTAILPELVQFTDYIYTLLGLTVATLILVINLQHIMKLWHSLRNVQSLLCGIFAHVAKLGIRWLFETRNLLARIRQPDLEMQTGNLGEFIGPENTRNW